MENTKSMGGHMIITLKCDRCEQSHTIQTVEPNVMLVCHCGNRLTWDVHIQRRHISNFKTSLDGIPKIAAIVGKGPTAPYYERLDLIIGINDAIYLIDEDLPVILARGDYGNFCKVIPPNVTPIVPTFLYETYPGSYCYDYVKDLGMPKRLCTVCAAIAMAHYLGAEQIRMYGFDAIANGDFSYHIKNSYNNTPLADQKPQLRQLSFELLSKCWIMDRPHNLIKLTETL